MVSILQYPFVTPFTYAASFVENASPLVKWYLNGKLGEQVQVKPSNKMQVIEPSSRNRFIQNVTVGSQDPKTFIKTLTVDSTLSINIPCAVSAVSDTVATATVTVANNIVTVTGVAAGTTTIRVYDYSAEKIIGLIVVTVESATV